MENLINTRVENPEENLEMYYKMKVHFLFNFKIKMQLLEII